jgi:ABC-type molybdate transport system substrate-binding protein
MAQYVGPIPGGLQNYTVFVAGIMSGAKASEAVTGFVKFLKSPFAVSAIRAKGMQID